MAPNRFSMYTFSTENPFVEYDFDNKIIYTNIYNYGMIHNCDDGVIYNYGMMYNYNPGTSRSLLLRSIGSYILHVQRQTLYKSRCHGPCRFKHIQAIPSQVFSAGQVFHRPVPSQTSNLGTGARYRVDLGND